MSEVLLYLGGLDVGVGCDSEDAQHAFDKVLHPRLGFGD